MGFCFYYEGKIDFSSINEQEKPNQLLLNFLNDLFNNRYTIRGISNNLSLLNSLYEKNLNKTDQIFLGDSIISFKDYYSFSVSPNLDKAYFLFSKGHFIDMDKFVASLYKSKIRYGFDIEEINKGLGFIAGKVQLDNSKLCIARRKNPVDGIDSKLEIVSEKVVENRRAKDSLIDSIDLSKKVDFFNFVNTTFDVKAGEILFKKIDASKGTKGRNIKGEIIPNKEGVDLINLDELGEGLEVKDIDGFKCIVAKISGKFNINSIDGSFDLKNMSVTEGIVISGNVDVKKGDIEFKKGDNVIIKGDLCEGRKIKGNPDKITIEGNMEGIIDVSGDTEIIILGNMLQKSEITHKGKGVIYVSGVMSNNSVLMAKRSSVTIEQLKGGTIYANELHINTVFMGNIVGNNIKIHEITNKEKLKEDGKDDTVIKRIRGYNVTIIGENIEVGILDSVDTTIRFILSGRDMGIKTGKKISDLKFDLERLYKDLLVYLTELDVKFKGGLKFDSESDILVESERINTYLNQLSNAIQIKIKDINSGHIPITTEISQKRLSLIKNLQTINKYKKDLSDKLNVIKFLHNEINNINLKNNDKNLLKINEVLGDSFAEVYSYFYKSSISLYDLLEDLANNDLVKSKKDDLLKISSSIFLEIGNILKSVFPEDKTRFSRDTNIRFGKGEFVRQPKKL